MKALILSGGHGTRLRPITYSQQKQLIPVANKPVLFYAIEDVISAGIREIGIIVGPNKDQVISTVESVDWDADITFIFQGEPLGLAHAIKVAREFLGDDSFVMYLGDNLLKEGIKEHLIEFRKSGLDASILLCRVSNPQQFGVAEIDEERGVIKRLIEKPKRPPSNLALVGIYFLTPVIHKAVDKIKPSWRGELEITDALQWLIDNGYRVGWTEVKGWWKDTGKPDDLLEANRLILDDIVHDVRGELDPEVKIFGRVLVEEGASLRGKTVVKGPAIIGSGSTLIDAYVGPYTSIGSNVIIEMAEIEDSIVMDGSRITTTSRIIESVIGKNVEISDRDLHPVGKRFIVGDNSKLLL